MNMVYVKQFNGQWEHKIVKHSFITHWKLEVATHLSCFESNKEAYFSAEYTFRKDFKNIE